jgi:hypothetical protein
MGENIEEEISRMFLKDMSLEEELALYFNRFNLDEETIEVMPAFEEHIRLLYQNKE